MAIAYLGLALSALLLVKPPIEERPFMAIATPRSALTRTLRVVCPPTGWPDAGAQTQQREEVMATRHRLSKHFTVEEFDCHNGARVMQRDYNGLEYLCKTFLEPLRKKFGRVRINSGYRTKEYNASIGGASNSMHVYTIHDGNDQAADITCQRGTPREWHAVLANIRRKKRGGNGGLGLYGTFLHVDIRDYKADWYG
jgi:hypothetical protein